MAGSVGMNIEPASVHRLKNQLAIIQGFCELLLIDLQEDDRRRSDVLRIQEACQSALKELPANPGSSLVDAGDHATEAKRGG